ncbi:MAG: RluA family pseudouridine synthase [Candidatus Marinimicrobia bacterium]|nr:RluA family pseudouridine synthase [Candidatus Neomarinimicrobiota bacterium]
MNIQIIYEDENIVAVNKPTSLLVHPAPTTKEETTLVDWIKKNYPETKNVGDDPELRPGIVHRLDKETSGILIITKNQKTFEFLKNQFANRKVQKTYLALTKGVFKKDKGVIDIPIGRSKSNPTKRLASGKARGKLREAITEYEVLKKYKGYTLLQVFPKTGRTHQIRVHFKALGHPIVCDKLYSNKKSTQTSESQCPFDINGHFLHAKSIELTLLNNTRIKLEAGLPDDLSKLLKSLQEYDRN